MEKVKKGEKVRRQRGETKKERLDKVGSKKR